MCILWLTPLHHYMYWPKSCLILVECTYLFHSSVRTVHAFVFTCIWRNFRLFLVKDNNRWKGLWKHHVRETWHFLLLTDWAHGLKRLVYPYFFSEPHTLVKDTCIFLHMTQPQAFLRIGICNTDNAVGTGGVCILPSLPLLHLVTICVLLPCTGLKSS